MKSADQFFPMRVVKTLWLSFLVSQIFYFFILFKLDVAQAEIPGGGRYLPNLSDPWQLGCSLAAIIAVVASFKIPHILARASRSAVSKSEAPEEKIPAGQFPTRLLVPFLLRLILMETICLVGFALAMTQHNPRLFLSFFAVSLMLYLKNYPSDANKVAADILGSSLK